MSWDSDDIKDELRKLGLKPFEIIRLFHPERKPIKDANISIGFTAFDEWVNDLPEPLQNPLRRAVANYRIAQADYRRHVAEQLALIGRKQVGRAVLAVIKSATHKLAIMPFRPQNDKDINADAFGFSQMKGTMLGFAVRDTTGHAVRDTNGAVIRGQGGGTPVIIDYSPDMWGKRGSAHLTGPGSEPDEVLLHELVHAGRELKGVESTRAVGNNDVDLLYENEEEFVAIVITNIYLSEKKQTRLRGTHAFNDKKVHGAVVGLEMDSLPDPKHFLLNAQGTTLEPSELMEKIRYRQPSLWQALVRIKPADAAFNPVRDWEPQRKVGLIDL